MGNVVNIKKSTDDDLQALFVDACPEVPVAVNDKVRLAANNALGGGAVVVYQPSFKTVCVIVAGACLLGAALVKGATSRWNNAVDSAALYTVQAESLNQEAMIGAALPVSAESEDSSPSWHRSKIAWAQYIARLERDPFYQHVQQEKIRFAARYQTQSDQSVGHSSD